MEDISDELYDEDEGICELPTADYKIQPTTIVIFGATGDLTQRKIIPALYNLTKTKNLTSTVRIIGFARRELSHAEFRQQLFTGLQQFSHTQPIDISLWKELTERIYYHAGEFSNPESYQKLKDEYLSCTHSECQNIIFYLATGPEQFSIIAKNLEEVGLGTKGINYTGFRRLIVEKPFGRNLTTAQELNNSLEKCFTEKDIYRIDHYLGKDTVQNLMYFRFANSIYEPLWNRRYIDHVQISVLEKMGVGSRGGYYDNSGASRDMLQNHILQLLSLVAMEPPAALAAEFIRDEKVKVLRSIPKYSVTQMQARTIRGQYSAGKNFEGKEVLGYLSEAKVAANSQTETYVGLKVEIDNWRWAGVPFYLQTGKATSKQVSEINVIFKRPPGVLFAGHCGERLKSNRLTIRIQPEEGIYLRFNAKAPGKSTVQKVGMNFVYRDQNWNYFPEAYERLILDVMAGDATLFTRSDELQEAWRIVDTIHQSWQGQSAPILYPYPAGTDGPSESINLFAKTPVKWELLENE